MLGDRLLEHVGNCCRGILSPRTPSGTGGNPGKVKSSAGINRMPSSSSVYRAKNLADALAGVAIVCSPCLTTDRPSSRYRKLANYLIRRTTETKTR
jgi:hypothetical protein